MMRQPSQAAETPQRDGCAEETHSPAFSSRGGGDEEGGGGSCRQVAR